MNTAQYNVKSTLLVSSSLHPQVQLSNCKHYATGWTALGLWVDFRWDDRNTYSTESTLHWDSNCYL